MSGLTVDQVVEGKDAGEVLHKIKLYTASKCMWPVSSHIRRMGDIDFAREAVKRYDKTTGYASTMPMFPADFIRWSLDRQLASVLDD